MLAAVVGYSRIHTGVHYPSDVLAGAAVGAAAGGDGTVGAAASHVAHTDAVLAIIPLGTSNDVARSLLVPTNPMHAVRLLNAGKISTADAGQVTTPEGTSRLFVHAATVGLNVDFARLATTASLRDRFGRFTYAVAAARALRECTTFPCELRHPGGVERLQLVHLSIVNAPVFGGILGMRVAGGDVDDRALDVIAAEHLPLRRLLLASAYHLFGRTRAFPGIHTFSAAALQVHTDRPLDVALDG